MSEQPEPTNVSLQIWQQNLNASLAAQESMMNSLEITKQDVLAIQEPHVNFLRNTCASHNWHVIYPTYHYLHPQKRSRAITFVNTSLDTNTWKQVPFPSSDVVIIQICGDFGICTIINIYNDCTHQDTLTALDTFLAQNIVTLCPTANDHMLWLGDFNRHHPMWKEIRNRHLFNYPLVRPLIDLIADYGMLQLLPGNIPTLQSTATGNWTCPDNVFGTEGLLDAVVSCTTEPYLCGPKTDHLPILLALNLEVPRTTSTPRLNWRDVDWTKFNETLSTALDPLPPLPLASADEFQQMARHIMQAITSTAKLLVPQSKPCPHSKRWWTRTLTDMRKRVSQLSRQSHQMRGLPLHPCHEEYKSLKNQYANEIASTKKQHWIDWLEDIEGNDLWTANRYISSDPSDGGKARIPTLVLKKPDGSTIEATTNAEKSTLIAEAFFPPLLISTQSPLTRFIQILSLHICPSPRIRSNVP